jgi:hypothetical protein
MTPMPDESNKGTPPPESTAPPASVRADDAEAAAGDDERGAERTDRVDRSITDFVRRAVSAGVVAAGRSKDDIMRAAGGEIRGWLEHLNLSEEIEKALSRMVIEVKTEIRFRSTEDGKIVSEATNDVKVKAPR